MSPLPGEAIKLFFSLHPKHCLQTSARLWHTEAEFLPSPCHVCTGQGPRDFSHMGAFVLPVALLAALKTD